MTKSTPISPPARKASAAAMTVSTWLGTFSFRIMVMQAVYITVLTDSYRSNPGRWAASAVRISWEGELRTAATLIPAPLRGSLLPVELSERRPS